MEPSIWKKTTSNVPQQILLGVEQQCNMITQSMISTFMRFDLTKEKKGTTKFCLVVADLCKNILVCYVKAAGICKDRLMVFQHPVMYSFSLHSTSQPALISGSGVCCLAGILRYNYFLTHEEQRRRVAKRRGGERKDGGMNNEV